jgi:hypothetical protein
MAMGGKTCIQGQCSCKSDQTDCGGECIPKVGDKKSCCITKDCNEGFDCTNNMCSCPGGKLCGDKCGCAKDEMCMDNMCKKNPPGPPGGA